MKAITDYYPYAFLPAIEIKHSIQIGPVYFWPLSDYKEFISENDINSFKEYVFFIQSQSGNKNFEIDLIRESQLTCISLSKDIDSSFSEFLLIDALHLFYFASTFQQLYEDKRICSFDQFQKMIPFTSTFMAQKEKWCHLQAQLTNHKVKIESIDDEVLKGLGLALESIYQPTKHQDLPTVNLYKRLVRAIRYFVHHLSPNFVNLMEKNQEILLERKLFEPEEIIFLASSFEVLFNLDDKQPVADFKHKLRPYLHLKYGGPVEIFWKWVDDFYKTKYDMIHGESIFDPIFRLNPNFEVSHLLVGTKIFIYSVCYLLHRVHLLTSIHYDAYTPPDFKWIHPEVVLLFFWTESNILRKLNNFMTRFLTKPSDELTAEITQLTNLFVFVYDHYYLENLETDIRFIPSPLREIEKEGKVILEHSRLYKNNPDLWKNIHPKFIEYLKMRLIEKKEKIA